MQNIQTLKIQNVRVFCTMWKQNRRKIILKRPSQLTNYGKYRLLGVYQNVLLLCFQAFRYRVHF